MSENFIYYIQIMPTLPNGHPAGTEFNYYWDRPRSTGSAAWRSIRSWKSSKPQTHNSGNGTLDGTVAYNDSRIATPRAAPHASPAAPPRWRMA